jgi:hypothetical protein
VTLPDHIAEKIRGVIEQGGGTYIDEEARGHGAIALMGTLGSIWMLRPDGTLWDADADWGKSLTPLGEEWRTRAIVEGVDRFPWLAELLPKRSPESADCSFCKGAGRSPDGKILCFECEGLGWRQGRP